MNWLYYLLEANLYLGIFYLCYCLFLNRETYYMLNRIYLLSTCVISFVVPVMQLGILRPTVPATQNLVVIAPLNIHQNNLPVKITPVASHFNMQDGLLYIYLLGATILVIVFAIKLYRLLQLTQSKSVINKDQYKLIYINGSNTAFSFFNYLFIGTKAPERETIIRHELVHISQKHSLDIILLEIFKVINWFNPIIYLLQNSLKTVHEYIADEKTATAEVDAFAYSTFLVNSAYGISGSSITHSFFNYNLLKKRIIMLNQKRSDSLARLKYLVTAPVCAALLSVSTLGFSKTYGLIDLLPKKADTGSIAPPSLPKPPALKQVVKLNSPTQPFGSITKKGYKYAESGYLVDGKSYFRVIIQESENVQKEYWKNKVSPAEIKMLRDKYAYTFPSMPIYPKLPPPPPIPGPPNSAPTLIPPVKSHGPLSVKRYPPIVVAPDTIAPEKPVKPVAPPPPRTPFDSLYKYIAKYVRYPKSARVNIVAGRVIINFNIIDGKIEDVTMPRGLFPDIDGEAMRVINNYKAPLNVKSANYSIAISFALIDKAGNYVGGPPKTNNKNTVTVPQTKMVNHGDSYMLNEVVVVSYL